MTSIAIPGGVCCIGDFTFYGCASLTNVTMAAGVTQIRQCAFGGCTSLESITLPSTVVCIMGNAFEGCSSLNTVLFDGSAPSTGSEVFNDADNVTVYRMPSAVGWGATLDGRPVLLWPPLPPAPHAATATGSVINGFVVAASITDEGWGYTNTPPVRIIGGGGSGAQAVALVTNGVLVAVDVVAAGSGYTSAPVVIIEPPFIPQPTMGITVLTFGPQVSPVLELNLGSLSPYDNYQLEFTPAVGGAWTNLGNPFTPTSSAIVQYANGTGKLGFFRVKYVP
ncbi:MAG: leucine-rich repeat domain-containing protein [Limisphaerales bacterium]